MEILVLGVICLYSVSACIWVVWKELSFKAVHPSQGTNTGHGYTPQSSTAQLFFANLNLCCDNFILGVGSNDPV